MENITNAEAVVRFKELIKVSSKKNIAYLNELLNNVISDAKDIPADDKIAQELAQYWINYYTEQLENAKHLIEQEKQWIASLSKIKAKLL